jgi:predicted enzyme related to lactoylglutathione lyase
MSDSRHFNVGSITWTDLTVQNAEEVRDFYSKIIGWKFEEINMGKYNDFNMNKPHTGEAVAGICHARGANANLTAHWLIYIKVKDVDQSVKDCVKLGGKILTEPKKMGNMGRYCVIEDPVGAVAALYSPNK